MIAKRLASDFFNRDVLHVAPELVGKVIVRKFDSGEIKRYRITETEAYRGNEDLACHASKGRTNRTEIMFHEGGHVYVYFIYGMYWMLNFVTSAKDYPAAALIRGVEGYSGPGKVGKLLQLDKTFYGENLSTSARLWVEDDGYFAENEVSNRIGVEYAGTFWSEKKWRFSIKKR